MQTTVATQDCWYIAGNEVDVFHYGFLRQGATLKTGQPTVTIYSTEEAMLADLPDDLEE